MNKPPTSQDYHQAQAGWKPDNKDDKRPMKPKDIGKENSMRPQPIKNTMRPK